MDTQDAYNVDMIQQSFDIIIDEIDESIEWFEKRMAQYPKTISHEYTYTIDVAHAYNKKITNMYNDILDITKDIINTEIKYIYEYNLDQFMIRINSLNNFINMNRPTIEHMDNLKYYS